MIIKVLGTGCKKCDTLMANVKEAIANKNSDATVEKVDDLQQILSYKVMSTPALVIDEKVVSKGKVLKTKEIEDLI
ncbi:MAG: thioredoxin family protein [Clostridia bacterium]|nr:thioredoxin family protein [Clostridia bacterium]